MRMCQACSEGRHWDCGCQTWCECECDPTTAIMDAVIAGEEDPDAERCDQCGQTSGCLMNGLCPMCYETGGGVLHRRLMPNAEAHASATREPIA